LLWLCACQDRLQNWGKGRNVNRGSRRQVFTYGFSILQYAVTYRKRRYANTVTSGYATSKSLLYHLLHCSIRSHEKLKHFHIIRLVGLLAIYLTTLSVVQNTSSCSFYNGQTARIGPWPFQSAVSRYH